MPFTFFYYTKYGEILHCCGPSGWQAVFPTEAPLEIMEPKTAPHPPSGFPDSHFKKELALEPQQVPEKPTSNLKEIADKLAKYKQEYIAKGG